MREPAGRLASPATTTSPPSWPPTSDGTMTGAAHQDARRPRLRRRRRQSVEVPGRPVPHRAPARTTCTTAHVEVDGVYTNKPPGGVAYRCSFRVTEAVHAIERMVDILAHELEHGPGRAADEELHPAGAVPVQVGARLGVRQRQLPGGAATRRMDKIGYAELRKEQAEKRARGELMGIGISTLHRDRRRRAVEALRHPRHQDVRQRRDPHPPDRQGDRALRHASRRARATRRPTRRSSPRSWASPPTNIKVEEGDTDTAPYGLGTYASRSTPIAGAADGDGGAQDPRKGAARSPRTCSRSARTTSSGSDYKFQVKGAPRAAEDDAGDRLRRLHQPSAGHGGRARGGRTTTIRRT